MSEFGDLPESWVVWNEEEERCVLAYRPDVFDGEAFPSACLPTLYLTRGRRSRRPGHNPTDRDADWYVTLYLEPEVHLDPERFASHEAAVERTGALAVAFDEGRIDYRELYQLPRERYFERLDELTGGP